ncbi:MAG: hypothetical protein WDN25_26465 [Acetobacteraceae bacterium]
MPSISKDQLFTYAQNADTELRLVKPNEDSAGTIETREGTFLGRMMRSFKAKEPNLDRTDKQVEYHGAQHAVWQSLREIYGEEIGEKAFRAGGFGFADQRGTWTTDANFPLTGRHIEKMMRTAEMEVMRNAHLAQWVADARGIEGDPPDVLLGARVSKPAGRVSLDEAFQGLSDDLEEDCAKWLRDPGDRHGLWILDVAVRGGQGQRIGIQVDRENPDSFLIHDRSGDYQINRGDLGAFLKDYMAGRAPDGLRSISLHRAEVDTTTPWLEQTRNEMDGPFRENIDWRSRGVKKWADEAVSEIETGSRLLRRQTSNPKDAVALRTEINLQLAGINRLLNDADVVVGLQLSLDERYQFNDRFRHVLSPALGSFGFNRDLQRDIQVILSGVADDFITELRVARGSLTEEAAQQRLLQRLDARLEQVLADGGVDDAVRRDARAAMQQAIEPWLAQLGRERLVPLREASEQINAPLCARITAELDSQRLRLEAKSKELAPLVGIEPDDGMLDLDDGVRGGDRERLDHIDWKPDGELERRAPLRLQFSKEGDDFVARMPNMFGQPRAEGGSHYYGGSDRRVATWDRLTENHQRSLSEDDAGLPGSGREQMTSTRLVARMETANLTLRIDDGDADDLKMRSNGLYVLRNLADPGDKNHVDLSEEQYCALTRFLDDSAFQAAYDQAVRRMFPSGTPSDCQNVDIQVRTSWDENSQPVFDITFRAQLPEEGGDLAFQAMNADGRPGEQPTSITPSGSMDLSVTLHVPLGQLQQREPGFTLDEPRIVFREVPDDYARIFNLPPHSLNDFGFEDRGDHKALDIADLVPDVAIKGQFDQPFDTRLATDDAMTIRGPDSEKPSIYLGRDIASRGGIVLERAGTGLQSLENANQAVNGLRNVRLDVGGDDTMALDRHQAAMLTRFLNVHVFDNYFAAVGRQLGISRPEDLPEVRFDVVARRDFDHNLVFDIAMRGALPEGVGKDHPELVPGQGLDLVVGLRVPQDQLDQTRPQYEIIPPEIRTRPE